MAITTSLIITLVALIGLIVIVILWPSTSTISERGRIVEAIARKTQLTAKELAIVNGEYARRKKSTGLAYALWFFFGILGLHRFYLGLTGWGIAYLLTLGLLGLGCLWDLFALAGMTGQKNAEIDATITEEVMEAR